MEQQPPSAGPGGPRHRDEDPLKRLAQHSQGIGSMGAAGKYAGVGLQFALSILLFLYLGQWLDRRVGTNGIFALLGAFLGFGAAFYSIYRSLMADQRREEEAEAQKRADAKRTEGAGQ
jgi:F0F1-type ATP synthase assembly protein I